MDCTNSNLGATISSLLSIAHDLQDCLITSLTNALDNWETSDLQALIDPADFLRKRATRTLDRLYERLLQSSTKTRLQSLKPDLSLDPRSFFDDSSPEADWGIQPISAWSISTCSVVSNIVQQDRDESDETDEGDESDDSMKQGKRHVRGGSLFDLFKEQTSSDPTWVVQRQNSVVSRSDSTRRNSTPSRRGTSFTMSRRRMSHQFASVEKFWRQPLSPQVEFYTHLTDVPEEKFLSVEQDEEEMISPTTITKPEGMISYEDKHETHKDFKSRKTSSRTPLSSSRTARQDPKDPETSRMSYMSPRTPNRFSLVPSDELNDTDQLPQASAWNNYLGFCVGAWRAQLDEEDPASDTAAINKPPLQPSTVNCLHSNPANSRIPRTNTVKSLATVSGIPNGAAPRKRAITNCSNAKCAFRSDIPLNHICQSHGVRVRSRFLIKSHCQVARKASVPKAQNNYNGNAVAFQCMFCVLMRRKVPVLRGMAEFFEHLAGHRECSMNEEVPEVVREKMKCVVGRAAADWEEWDVNLLPKAMG